MANRWQFHEDEILKVKFPLDKREDILPLLLGRTWLGITQRAEKLGIKRLRCHEDSIYKNVYGTFFACHQKEDNYLVLTIGSKKVYEHRYVWKLFHGPIPKGYEIHHVDGDRSNNLIENLECLHSSEHHSRDREIRKSMTAFLKEKNLYKEWLKQCQ